MKKFEYDLLENRSHLIEQDNSGDGRVYHAPNGSYPSVTTVLYEMISKTKIQAWRKRVGAEKANRISAQASSRGTSVHNALEKYLLGDESYLEGVSQDNKEVLALAIPEINEKIDNIRGVELKMWSDDLRLAGTSDLIAEYEGELSIIDWKNSTYVKKDEYLKSYILQGTAYARMLYEMYGIIPKNIVICSLIRFGADKPNPFLDKDIHIDWRVFSPLQHIRELKQVCDDYHVKFKKDINIFDMAS